MKKTSSLIKLLTMLLIITACNSGQKQEEKSTENEVATPSGPKVEGNEVSYATDSTQMNGYIAFDANKEGKRPGVLVVHEWWGHNDYVRKRADMLAELGYVALAVDMYGDGKQAAHPEDAGKFSSQVIANMDEAKARFESAMEVLKNNPNVDTDKIAAIGYCFGGSVVLTMANAGYDLDAVAAFHSGVQLPIQPTDQVTSKVLVQNGADDPFISPESVDAFKSSMESAGVDYEYIDYPSAVHAFTNPGATELGKKFELPLAYQKEADEASWNKMQELFNSVF